MHVCREVCMYAWVHVLLDVYMRACMYVMHVCMHVGM